MRSIDIRTSKEEVVTIIKFADGDDYVALLGGV